MFECTRNRKGITLGSRARSALCRAPCRLIVLALSAVLAGCAAGPHEPFAIEDTSALLTGERVFGEEILPAVMPVEEILALSPEMQAYVEAAVGDRRLSAARFRRVFGSLMRDGYFASVYQPDRTYTAAETFIHRAGNCLSYTTMFIALTRAAGLDARYQIVEVPPSWDATSGYLIRFTHVNVLMKGVRFDKAGGAEFSVDFNEVHPDPEYTSYEISDEYAASLFYANRSVNLFRNGENREAFAYLRRAIEMAPRNPDLWINLGAFYSKLEDLEAAVQSYQVALSLDGSNRGAMSGLGRAYQLLGENELAEYYNAQVRAYRERNPYYHFAVAQTEFENARYSQALVAIDRAIDLKHRNGRFHFLKALTEQKLGNVDAAKVSFRRAERFGSYSDLKRRYQDDMAGVSFTSSS